MIAATVFGIIVIPPLYVFVQTLRERVKGTAAVAKPSEPAEG
jgi:hypothetical protein